MQKLELAQQKVVFEELSGHLSTNITKQSFVEGLILNRIEIAKGITPEVAHFSLYCIELFEILLQQQRMYILPPERTSCISLNTISEDNFQ